MRTLSRTIAGSFLIMLFLSVQAYAQTCTFDLSGVNFGNVNLLSGGTADSSATLNMTCKNTLNVSLFLRVCPNIGEGSGGSSGGTRLMQNGSGQPLSFQLYQNAARTVPWGSVDQPQFGSPPPIDILLLPLTSTTPPATTLYGRILGSQASAAGGNYISTFSGANTRFSYKAYTLVAPPCNTLTDNPTQVPFVVQANVDRTCNVSAQNINFGTHGILNTQLDAAGSLAVTCTLSLPYTISLNGGLANATSPVRRKMLKGSESVEYGLYGNASRTQPWGNSAGQTVSGVGTGLQQALPVYGRVLPQPTPSPGLYSDTVVVTVTY
jgi:spore coat protein U-like protein